MKDKNVYDADFSTVITSKSGKKGINLKEVVKYRDLISLFVGKNLKTRYRQTILGPIWYILQPLISSLIYTLIFGTLARDITDKSVPAYLFYMAGNVPWLFFSTCLTNTSSVFRDYSRVFTKVYFPRLSVPISTIITNAFTFLIQFVMFLVLEGIYFAAGAEIKITWAAALLPLVIIELGFLSMGVGLIFSAITAKYRDLLVMTGFISTLWMYLSPVVYGAESFGVGSVAHTLVMLNPVSPAIEIIRYGFLGSGSGVPWLYFGISVIFTAFIWTLGAYVFNRTERNFADTV